MKTQIALSPDAVNAIRALRHSAGTYELYNNTLTRIFNQILHTSEDLGMDDLEAIETLRALDMLRSDLAAIAEDPEPQSAAVDGPIAEIEDEEETLVVDEESDA